MSTSRYLRQNSLTLDRALYILELIDLSEATDWWWNCSSNKLRSKKDLIEKLKKHSSSAFSAISDSLLSTYLDNIHNSILTVIDTIAELKWALENNAPSRFCFQNFLDHPSEIIDPKSAPQSLYHSSLFDRILCTFEPFQDMNIQLSANLTNKTMHANQVWLLSILMPLVKKQLSFDENKVTGVSWAEVVAIESSESTNSNHTVIGNSKQMLVTEGQEGLKKVRKGGFSKAITVAGTSIAHIVIKIELEVQMNTPMSLMECLMSPRKSRLRRN